MGPAPLTNRVRQILFVAPAPLVWAEHLGCFASYGLDVETTRTLSSDQIGQGLADDRWDIGIGVVDNVIAWNAERGAGLRIVAQLERRQVMAFCAKPDCHTLADATGGVTGVDATSNGFVLVLYRALAQAGIRWQDCQFEEVGGVRQRFEALMQGQIDATILVPPFIDQALAAGLRQLWSIAEIAPSYPGVVAAAPGRWIDANRAAALAYLQALREANYWGMNPANRDDAVAALQAAGYSAAAATYLAGDGVSGLAVSRAGWDETVTLRSEAGLMPVPAPSFESVVDAVLMRDAAGLAPL